MVIRDYPDYMQHVERTPIQVLPYQDFASFPASQDVLATAWGVVEWEIPDDDKLYIIDSVFFITTEPYIFLFYLSYYETHARTVQYHSGCAVEEYCAEIVPSKQGAMMLEYPNVLQFAIYNPANYTVSWEYICNYYTYMIG